METSVIFDSAPWYVLLFVPSMHSTTEPEESTIHAILQE